MVKNNEGSLLPSHSESGGPAIRLLIKEGVDSVSMSVWLLLMLYFSTPIAIGKPIDVAEYLKDVRRIGVLNVAVLSQVQVVVAREMSRQG